tara:strand:+ start:1323 stop:1442 length:120 start_codon:yes stop_codon:yes gene_type:complete
MDRKKNLKKLDFIIKPANITQLAINQKIGIKSIKTSMHL